MKTGRGRSHPALCRESSASAATQALLGLGDARQVAAAKRVSGDCRRLARGVVKWRVDQISRWGLGR